MLDLIYILAFLSLIPLMRMLYSLVVERRKANIESQLFDIWYKEHLSKKEFPCKISTEPDIESRLLDIWIKEELSKTKKFNKKSKIKVRFSGGPQFELKNANDLERAVNLLKEGINYEQSRGEKE